MSYLHVFRVIAAWQSWPLPGSPHLMILALLMQDRTIKIWDMASGQLKLTLTGHIEQVTGLVVSPRHPYMFSVGLDKMVKCWDLEQNKVRVISLVVSHRMTQSYFFVADFGGRGAGPTT